MRTFIFLFGCLLFSSFLCAQNVGIGTSAPEVKLHVVDSISVYDGTNGAYINIQNVPLLGTDGSMSGIRFRVDGVNAGLNARYKGGILFQKTGSWGVGSIHFVTNAIGNNSSVTANDARMTIASGGNIGIGTIDPVLGKLDLRGSTGGNLLHAAVSSGTGFSMSVVTADPTFGFNTMLNSGYKFMGNGYAGMFQYSPSTGDLKYFSSNASGTAGNAITFLGTFFTLDAAGRLGLSTTAPTAKLHVNGNMVIGGSAVNPATGYSLSIDGRVICEEARVQNNVDWPDYVFRENYKLLPLDQLEKIIREQGHLPNIPPASIVKKEGFDLGGMNARLLEKIEELTLYILQLENKNKDFENRLKKLENKDR
ncbi:MAG TPA: hypothetical protein VFO70_02880 [Chitinophagaceae bacterium]|nr:hypothetical protein [Chitinophagaceae bacterium]